MTLNLPIIPRAYIDRSTAPALCKNCYEPSEEMFVCGGACRKAYCSWCIIQYSWRLCPGRCSTECMFQPLRNNHCTYLCPYRECADKMNSAQTFWEHCKTCKYVTPQAKDQLNFRLNYRCKAGHKLFFVNESNFDQIYQRGSHYNTTNSEVCNYCYAKFLSNSVCLQCGLLEKKGVYCINCRPIPCSKTHCPIGHQLTITTIYGDGMICDFCGIRAKICKGDVYSDRECNFDICSDCYKKIPEKNPLTPLQNEIPQHLNFKQVARKEEEALKPQEKEMRRFSP